MRVHRDIERLMIMSLIITEVVTNCLKDAFGCSGGAIDLQLRRNSVDRLELTISDDGRGLPADPDQR